MVSDPRLGTEEKNLKTTGKVRIIVRSKKNEATDIFSCFLRNLITPFTV
jgi:hypothetical protein